MYLVVPFGKLGIQIPVTALFADVRRDWSTKKMQTVRGCTSQGTYWGRSLPAGRRGQTGRGSLARPESGQN